MSAFRSRSCHVAAVVLAVSLLGGPVASQTPPSAPDVSPDPQQTTATFGDLVLRCSRVGPEGNQQRVCEVVQTLQREGHQGIVAQIAIGRLSAKDPLKLAVLLPVNIAITGAVRMFIDEKDTSGVDLGWRRCFPQGCLPDTDAKDDLLRGWRAQTGAGRLAFHDAANRDVVVQTSFKGLAPALDALSRH